MTSTTEVVEPGSVPLDPRDGLAPVAVADRRTAAHLVHDLLGRTIARVALPAVASSLLMTLFASVDAFWVGTRLGSDGLAAVSTSLFWIWMMIALAEMIGVGLTAVAARRHGEGRPTDAAAVAGDALIFTLAIGIAVSAIGLVALRGLFAVMHTPPTVTGLGVHYLGTYLLGIPLIYGFFAVDATFRASGDTRTPFILLIASVAVTLVLDPALMLGWGPLPRLGIAGAAIATVCTRGAAFAMGVILTIRRKLLHVRRPQLIHSSVICHHTRENQCRVCGAGNVICRSIAQDLPLITNGESAAEGSRKFQLTPRHVDGRDRLSVCYHRRRRRQGQGSRAQRKSQHTR